MYNHDWERVFWGGNYEELARVKKKPVFFSLLLFPSADNWLVTRNVYWIVGGVVSRSHLPSGRVLMERGLFSGLEGAK